MTDGTGGAAENIAILVLLVWVSLQGLALFDLQRKLSQLRRQVAAEREPTGANVAVDVGLPPLDGVTLLSPKPVDWKDCLPLGSGLVLVLDPVEESCWFLAEQVVHPRLPGPQLPLLLLVAASPIESQRFVRQTGLAGDSRVVLVGPRSSMLKRLGVSWRPAVLWIEDDMLRAAAQIHDIKHLEKWALEVSSRSGGEGLRSESVANRVVAGSIV